MGIKKRMPIGRAVTVCGVRLIVDFTVIFLAKDGEIW